MSVTTAPERARALRLPGVHPGRGAADPSALATRLLDGTGWTVLRIVLDLVTLGGASLLWILAAGAPGWSERWPLLLFAPLSMIMLVLAGLYRRRLRVQILDGVVPLARAVASAGGIVGLACVYLTEPVTLPALAGLVVCGFALDGGARVLAAGAQRVARVRGRIGRPTLIVGSGEIANRVARRLLAEPSYGLCPVGFLDVTVPSYSPRRTLELLGSPDDLEAVVERHGIRQVVLAYAAAGDRESLAIAHRAQRLGVELTVVPRLFDAMNARATYETVGGLPLMSLRLTQPGSRAFALKHAFDSFTSAVALLLLSPLLATVALLVKLSSPGPVLFRQRRAGLDGVPFELLKFRTMTGEAALGVVGEDGNAPGGVEGADRRTRIGRVLRRTSLDELPQLINVVRGDMSLVGPRPERPEFVAHYVDDLVRYGERHRVRAGITGLAQAHGLRGKTSLADRVELDNAYIEHWSFGLDVKILLLTIVALFRSVE